jgi:uncharacterized UBP type Zn finger protein
MQWRHVSSSDDKQPWTFVASFKTALTRIVHEDSILKMSSRDENLAMLLSMGFPQNRAEKAIFLTKNKGVQEAIDWFV